METFFQHLFFFHWKAQKEARTLKTALSHRYTHDNKTDRRLYRSWEMDVSAVWLWNDSDLERLCFKPTWWTAMIHKDEHTHTHTKKVESSGRQNGHRHLTLYFILVSVLQDAKYIIIMLYSQWRPIHQSVNWCGCLYTRPGFIEKWSMAWEQKQMKCVCGLGSSFRSPTGLLMGAQNNKDNILPKKTKNSPFSHYLPWF